MRREVDILEISDGKLYESSDLVKADCGGCEGCSSCCCGMGESIILDPMDIYHLTTNLKKRFEELLADAVSLSVYDGLILPHIQMESNRDACFFLSQEGRCNIHDFRPGICRLFPLGRYYEENGFRYFLQVHECKKQNRTKVKVKKWLGIPDLQAYEAYILQWHDFTKRVQEHLDGQDEAYIKRIDMFILQHFYIEKYAGDNFYSQFEERLKKAKEVIRIFE